MYRTIIVYHRNSKLQKSRAASRWNAIKALRGNESRMIWYPGRTGHNWLLTYQLKKKLLERVKMTEDFNEVKCNARGLQLMIRMYEYLNLRIFFRDFRIFCGFFGFFVSDFGTFFGT